MGYSQFDRFVAKLRLLLRVGREKYPGQPSQNNIIVVQSNITLPLPSGSFDHFTMLAPLEHLPRPFSLLSEACRVLKSGGPCILTMPFSSFDAVFSVLSIITVDKKSAFEQHQERVSLESLKRVLRTMVFTCPDSEYFGIGLNNWLVSKT
jgi:ubiquinone/menaquinone biosynthesis C-methylase UbiE